MDNSQGMESSRCLLFASSSEIATERLCSRLLVFNLFFNLLNTVLVPSQTIQRVVSAKISYQEVLIDPSLLRFELFGSLIIIHNGFISMRLPSSMKVGLQPPTIPTLDSRGSLCPPHSPDYLSFKADSIHPKPKTY